MFTMRPGGPVSAVGAEQRCEGLGDYHRRYQIDLELLAEFVGRAFQQRPRHRDAGIVDEAPKPPAVKCRADRGRADRDRGLIGHVEHQGRKGFAEFRLQPVGVSLLAHAAEHAEALRGHYLGDTPADTG
jgi:hypothetical protein